MEEVKQKNQEDLQRQKEEAQRLEEIHKEKNKNTWQHKKKRWKN